MSFYIRLIIFIAIFCLFVVNAVSVEAGQKRSAGDDIPETFRSTGQPLPRFASLAADKVNMRAGPARDYPVQWVYTRKNLPVEITLEYGSWRKIRDPEGDTGWVHQSLLSPKRYVRIESRREVIARRRPDRTSKPAIRLEAGVIARLKQCEKKYCKLNVGGYSGWVRRKMLWGIYADEKLD